MFRHAKAHRMKARGADLKDIQMMLGTCESVFGIDLSEF